MPFTDCQNPPTPDELRRVLTSDRPATAFDDLSDAEFDQVLDQIYVLHDWPARDAMGDGEC